MSYCVNCGVELAPSEKKCPLCGVEVVNPKSPYRQPKNMPYPRRLEKVVSAADRRFGVTLASLLLIIPVVIPLLTDMIMNKAVTWSSYVVGASACLFVFGLVPFLFAKPRPYLFWLFDSLAATGYIALIGYMTADFRWFWPLGLPLCVAVSLCSLLGMAVIRRRKWSWPYKTAGIVAVFGILSVLVDFIIYYNRLPKQSIHWSLFVVAPCIVIGLIMISLEKRQKLRDEIKRRLFY